MARLPRSHPAIEDVTSVHGIDEIIHDSGSILFGIKRKTRTKIHKASQAASSHTEWGYLILQRLCVNIGKTLSGDVGDNMQWFG